MEIETNDTWIRDFGGIEIEENGDITTLDFTFNAWGLKFAANYDNLVTRKLFFKKNFQLLIKNSKFCFRRGKHRYKFKRLSSNKHPMSLPS